jgi:hypothetical protein
MGVNLQRVEKAQPYVDALIKELDAKTELKMGPGGAVYLEVLVPVSGPDA